MKRYAYSKIGLLAINPRAFYELFAVAAPDDEVEIVDGHAIVSICGPLEHHAGWWCDSYDDISDRFDAACATQVKNIILKVDSPGGEVSGMVELARYMRDAAAASGKRLVGYVDGQASSAAYALLCAASEIVVPPSGFVGSAGIIDSRIDVTENDKAMGVRFAFVTSGKRKADGNPHKPLSESELAASQARVDSLAELFNEWIQETRKVDMLPLEAEVYHGKHAVKAGLADKVLTFEGLLASLAGSGEQTMATKYEEARAALEEVAKGEGEEAERARKALQCMDTDPEGDEDEEEEDEDAESDDDEEEKASSDASAAPLASAEATPTVTALATQVQKLSARVTKLSSRNETAERKAFLASRPDLAKELVTVLKDKPLAEVKAIVNAIKPAAKTNLSAEASAQGTLGETQTGDAPPSVSTEDEQMDMAMGITSNLSGIRKLAGGAVSYGVMSREQAAKIVRGEK